MTRTIYLNADRDKTPKFEGVFDTVKLDASAYSYALCVNFATYLNRFDGNEILMFQERPEHYNITGKDLFIFVFKEIDRYQYSNGNIHITLDYDFLNDAFGPSIPKQIYFAKV